MGESVTESIGGELCAWMAFQFLKGYKITSWTHRTLHPLLKATCDEVNWMPPKVLTAFIAHLPNQNTNNMPEIEPPVFGDFAEAAGALDSVAPRGGNFTSIGQNFVRMSAAFY